MPEFVPLHIATGYVLNTRIKLFEGDRYLDQQWVLYTLVGCDYRAHSDDAHKIPSLM